jgi:hypothetical protein
MIKLKRDQILIPCFCYGSNNIQQIRERVGNKNIKNQACILPGYLRIFAGKSATWGGGVVSIIDTPSEIISCRGTYVLFTEEEFRKMDQYEGTNTNERFNEDPFVNNYRREKVCIKLENGKLYTAFAYIKNSNKWDSYPSTKYLNACYKHLKPFWNDLDGNNSLLICDSNGIIRGEYFG